MASSGVCPKPQHVIQVCSARGGGDPPAKANQRNKAEIKADRIGASAGRFQTFTHVPGANKHRDHVRLALLGVSHFHQLEEVTEGVTFLGDRAIL